MKDIFEGKTILLTGGTGSFGQKFVEVLLRDHNPDFIRVYSRGELKQVEMERKFSDGRVRFLIGDVRNEKRLSRAMNGVDIVVHAAALKHVPVCEYNPREAIDTNILGAMNVVDAAIDNGVEKVLALSTDKAVQPINLYGSTKAVAEKLFVQGNVYSGFRKTQFSCVRYGNVLGSSGSVVPLFFEQRKTGEITITHEDMTRFWITLEQGVEFVIKSIQLMKGGEVFVPKIPSMRITDLAEVIAPDAKKKFVGIRPGEKIHELLLTSEDAVHSKEFDDYFIIEPGYPFRKLEPHTGGKPLPKNFFYASNSNTQWLNKDELRKILVGQGFL